MKKVVLRTLLKVKLSPVHPCDHSDADTFEMYLDKLNYGSVIHHNMDKCCSKTANASSYVDFEY